MAWMRTVAGRLKSDYRYSNTIVYNNFIWPKVTEKNKSQIEKTAQMILDARAKHRYLEAIQTCTLLLSSLFDEAERGDSFTTRATPEVLSETVWFNDFQPT